MQCENFRQREPYSDKLWMFLANREHGNVFCHAPFILLIRIEVMMNLIITNNPLTAKNCDGKSCLYLKNGTYLDVLTAVRDRVHLGAVLHTHPLSGSIKPNETPYKTVVIEDKTAGVDYESLQMIENAIAVTEKFLKNKPLRELNEKLREDFALIDYSLIYS